MLTLSEVSKRTGISMPTLQRYKKIYQNRIPAEGKGRKQRYPESALPVFNDLKNENAGRRGRPRKDASAPVSAVNAGNTGGSARRGRKPGRPAAAAAPAKKTPGRRGRKPAAPAAAKKASGAARGGRKAAAGGRGRRASGSGLLTLGQVSEQTGISYPTLVRYVRLHSDRLPSEGTGRSRRFRPEAVGVFKELRQESGRGGRKPKAAKAAVRRGPGRPRAAAAPAESDSGLAKRLKSIEKAQEGLEKKFRGFVQSLQKLFK
jgi:DNA-binding transcriptional MerR regulator